MMAGRVIGVCVATQKDPKLAGRKLLVVEPIKTDGTPAGKPAIAVDLVGAGAGNTALLAKSRDASLAGPGAPIAPAISGMAAALVPPPHQPISPPERGFRSC